MCLLNCPLDTTIVIGQECRFYRFEEDSEEVSVFSCEKKSPTSILPIRDENVALCNGLSGQVDCVGQVSLGISDAKCRVIGCRHRMLITTRCLCHKFINNRYIPTDCELFYLFDETPIPTNIDLCTGQPIPVRNQHNNLSLINNCVQFNLSLKIDSTVNSTPVISTKLDLLSPIEKCHMVPDPEHGQWRCDETSCQLL